MIRRALSAALLASAILAAQQLGAASYAMKVSVTAQGPWIKAGELLEGAVPKKIAELKVRRLEAPGKSVEIPRDLLAVKLREARLGEPVTLSGTATLVTASSRVVKGADIKAFVENTCASASARCRAAPKSPWNAARRRPT